MFQCFTILINILVTMNVIKLLHRPHHTPLNVVVVVINAPTQGYLRSFDIFSQFLVTSPSYSHSSSSSSWPLIMLAVSSPSSTLSLPAAFAAADIFLMAFIVGERRQGSHECAGVAVWRVKTGRGWCRRPLQTSVRPLLNTWSNTGSRATMERRHISHSPAAE